MGIYKRVCQQLASADLVVAHGGLAVFWRARRRTSSGQSWFSYREYIALVPGFAADDRSALAKRDGSRIVRGASGARRVGGVGVGKEGRAQYFFLSADDLVLRVLC